MQKKQTLITFACLLVTAPLMFAQSKCNNHAINNIPVICSCSDGSTAEALPFDTAAPGYGNLKSVTGVTSCSAPVLGCLGFYQKAVSCTASALNSPRVLERMNKLSERYPLASCFMRGGGLEPYVVRVQGKRLSQAADPSKSAVDLNPSIKLLFSIDK